MWTKLKLLKGWRTVALNVLAAIVPILSLTEWMAVLPAEYLPWYMLGITILNLWLRTLTTTPMGKSE